MDDMPNRVDVLLVDTIHTYEQVTKELTLWYSRLAPNAVVLGHDTEDVNGEPTEVKQAFLDFGNKMDVKRLEFRRGCYGMAVMRC
jgi:glycerol-3-phosphate cytidylyltransferase-like family protein